MNQCHANRILDCAVSGEQTLKDRSSQLQGGLQIKLPFQRLQSISERGGEGGSEGGKGRDHKVMQTSVCCVESPCYLVLLTEQVHH